ncbi:MAG: hypothetical protein H6574_05275 [Lewinellaceae bacterium]|nr:hypothetical protein [Saprospiraceae bacterium]MCB9330474.1 hypothetical protein [Lewinellaceae bacterium]
MEYLDQDFQSSASQLQPTREIRENWRITARWGNFLAIIGFVFIGFGLLAAFSLSTVINMMSAMGGSNPALELLGSMGGWLAVVVLIGLAVQFMIVLFQYRFAKNLKIAVMQTDQTALEEAWLQFRNLFRWYGIMIIASIIIGLLANIAMYAFLASSISQ